MHRANVSDRHSLEALYPREAFEEGATRNTLDKAEVVYGVRVDSAPDEHGWFEVARARRHVGEIAQSREAVFLAAERPQLSQPAGSHPEANSRAESRTSEESRQQEYQAFLDRVREAARAADIPQPIGSEETRLQGFRGG